MFNRVLWEELPVALLVDCAVVLGEDMLPDAGGHWGADELCFVC
jgi:hypothetical protein